MTRPQEIVYVVIRNTFTHSNDSLTDAVIAGRGIVFTTMAVLDILSDAYLVDYNGDEVFTKIYKMLWMNYSGGTTCAAAAHEICDKLGIAHDYDSKRY